MELKTLKDLKRKQYSAGEDKAGNLVKYFKESELKAEAIKNVLIGDQIKTKGERCVNAWIIYFFNITDEDLE